MLMKEFKSAHSKMFSKLRANSKEQQQQQQQHGHQQQTTDGHDNDNDDDHDDGDDDSDDQHCQVANGTDKNNNGGQQLIIRPMARTGCWKDTNKDTREDIWRPPWTVEQRLSWSSHLQRQTQTNAN